MSGGQIIANDPSSVIDARRLNKTLNNLIKIADASIVRATFLVGPQPGTGAVPDLAEGGSGLDGDSRFRCEHKLTATPNVVYVMRERVIKRNPPDVDNAEAFTKIGQRNSVTNAAVVVNTDYPIADEKYSYLTITFPMVGWHEISTPLVPESAPDVQRGFGTTASSNKWGDIRGGVIMDYGSVSSATGKWEWYVGNIGEGRTFGADTDNVGDLTPANLSVFFQQYMGTYVTVKIFSAVIDGLSFDGLAFPGMSGAAP